MHFLMRVAVLPLLVALCHLSEASPVAQGLVLRLPTTADLIQGAMEVECTIKSRVPGFTGFLVDKDGKVYEDQPDASGQKGPCASRPCLHKGTCQKTSDTDFKCTCPYPMGGKTCADLICESCFRKDDLVIFLNNTMESVTWPEAYDWCQSKGLHLLLDKDQEKHDFVTEVLKKLHPYLNEHVAYWIGVNRISKRDPWKFTDDSLVTESFQPWASGRPSSSLCVEVANGKNFNWLWDDERCDGDRDWSYYPLCEKHYPFLKATTA